MCHNLPLIAFTYAGVPCYGKLTTKDVCRSTRKAFLFDGSRKKSKIALLSLLVWKWNTSKVNETRSMRFIGSFNMPNRSLV